MWNPFRSTPTCPIEPEMRKWVDGRFQWLREQFGHDLPLNVPVILPTPEFFPDRFDGVPDDVQPMLNRVANFMNVDPAGIELIVYSANDPNSYAALTAYRTDAAGLYVQGTKDAGDGTARLAKIGIELNQLRDPTSLVATLAHEIGHELLLGQERLTHDEQDHEPLTDLLTVFFGLGIFMANATIRDRGWSTRTMAGWNTQRLGYLDQRTFGYALALFAYMREEDDLKWIKHVRPDVRLPLRESLKFLAANPP